jgi:polyisoprenyl-teichoic acid--peptidoglycan teichoic acid transferase
VQVDRDWRVMVPALLLAFLVVACGGPTAPSISVPPASSSATSEATTPEPTSSEPASASPSTAPTPSATPTTGGLGTDRINVLLLGVDRGPGREDQTSTDAMMVASIDPVGKTASFLSIPRDLVDVPLADGTPYRQKINSLVREVDANPDRFPGGDQGGDAALAGALSRFLGIDIPYWASIDFTGFKALVQAVDGIDVYAWRPICDAAYRDDRFDGFGVGVGRWRMDDDEALAWVRIRKPPPESDFTRTIRQVQALIGLRERIVETGLLADPLAALESLGVVRTNVPDDVIEGLAALAPELTNDRIYRRTIQPPELVDETSDARGYILVARDADIEAMVKILFPRPGERPTTGKVTRYVSDDPAKELTGASC